MKHFSLKTLSLIFVFVLAASVFSACGVDPNVKQEDDRATSDYVVDTGEDTQETEREGYHSYGNGKTDPVKIGGVDVSVKDFAVRSYELAFMMAQKNFDKPTDIPVDAAVQYAFSHVYIKDLNTITNKAMQYRDATEKQIRDTLKAYFGTDDFDVTSSVLYNPEKKIFEMWIPQYGTNIYYTVDAVNVSSDKAEITSTFFKELKRSTMLGRATVTVAVQDGKPVIRSLKAE